MTFTTKQLVKIQTALEYYLEHLEDQYGWLDIKRTSSGDKDGHFFNMMKEMEDEIGEVYEIADLVEFTKNRLLNE